MAWIQKLYETYESCIGKDYTFSEENSVLLPICHTIKKMDIEICIDGEGNFLSAEYFKNGVFTLIPCTESSAGRTSGEEPHPLCDSLQYIAKDYSNFGGKKKCYHSSYYKQLIKWNNSKYCHHKTVAIQKYVEKGMVLSDLIKRNVISEKEIDGFVRWRVQILGCFDDTTWKDKSLHRSWIQFVSDDIRNTGLCYITGEIKPLAIQHPRNIRRLGDGAKLISSGKSKDKVNDTMGFTFLGRYTMPEQALGVSSEVTQKAHSTLRWLIERQGYRTGEKDSEQVIVAWATSGEEIIRPFDDGHDILELDDSNTNESIAYTAQDLGNRLKKRITGYCSKLGNASGVVVMGLDSATKGRMAMTYYRELTGSDFLERIDRWHTECSWYHKYRTKEYIDRETGEIKKRKTAYVGAPAQKDIAFAAYSKKVNDRFQVDDYSQKITVERLLPCIIDGQSIPKDLVMQSVRKASNRIGLEDAMMDKAMGMKEYQWNKTLSIACALFRKFRIDTCKEVYSMSLDETRRTRDYLYGRLLALADSLEQKSLKYAGEDRQTNAARYMQRFSERPFSTWKNLELSLAPSKARLGSKANFYVSKITEVTSLFNSEDYISDKKLTGEFLLGYHCQREALWQKHTDEQNTKMEE